MFTVSVQDVTGYTCSVSGTSSGTMTAVVDDIAILCLATYSLGGTATLNGATVQLSVNQPDDTLQTKTLSDDSAWTFDTVLISGDVYAVTVTSPEGYVCSLTGDQGTIASDTTTVSVTCLPLYSLGGSATLNGATVELSVDQPGLQSITVSQDGAFTFTNELVSGSAYVVTASDPEEHDCQLEGSTEATIAQDTSDITITCTLSGYPVGGNATINGANGVAIQIVDNSNNFEEWAHIDEDGSFYFDMNIPLGTDYVLSVWNPSGYSCSVGGPFNGTVVEAVKNIEVTCEVSTIRSDTNAQESEDGGDGATNMMIVILIGLIIGSVLLACGALLCFRDLLSWDTQSPAAEKPNTLELPSKATSPQLTATESQASSITAWDFEAGKPKSPVLQDQNTESLYGHGFKE